MVDVKEGQQTRQQGVGGVESQEASTQQTNDNRGATYRR